MGFTFKYDSVQQLNFGRYLDELDIMNVTKYTYNSFDILVTSVNYKVALIITRFLWKLVDVSLVYSVKKLNTVIRNNKM